MCINPQMKAMHYLLLFHKELHLSAVLERACDKTITLLFLDVIGFVDNKKKIKKNKPDLFFK